MGLVGGGLECIGPMVMVMYSHFATHGSYYACIAIIGAPIVVPCDWLVCS